MAHTPFFKAGIAGDGNYNRTLTSCRSRPNGGSCGTPARRTWRCRRCCGPNRVNGALLMYHGMEDANVGTNPINSERLFAALDGLGKDAALYMYPYEGHGPLAGDDPRPVGPLGRVARHVREEPEEEVDALSPRRGGTACLGHAPGSRSHSDRSLRGAMLRRSQAFSLESTFRSGSQSVAPWSLSPLRGVWNYRGSPCPAAYSHRRAPVGIALLALAIRSLPRRPSRRRSPRRRSTSASTSATTTASPTTSSTPLPRQAREGVRPAQGREYRRHRGEAAATDGDRHLAGQPQEARPATRTIARELARPRASRPTRRRSSRPKARPSCGSTAACTPAKRSAPRR